MTMNKFKSYASLFITGSIQVFLVGFQTIQLANQKFAGVFIVGFLISFVWSWNVKKIAFGNLIDRIMYSTGAACGSLISLFAYYGLYK